MLAGDRPDLQCELGCGGESIAAHRHGGRSGMRFLAMKGDGVALDALGSQDHTQRQLHPFEHRPLLDMQFQVGAGLPAF